MQPKYDEAELGEPQILPVDGRVLDTIAASGNLGVRSRSTGATPRRPVRPPQPAPTPAEDDLDLPEPTDVTPTRWRLAAAMLLCVGFVVGDRVAGRATRRTAVVGAGLGVASWAVIMAAGLRAPRLDPGAKAFPASSPVPTPLPRLDVVIPARDEVDALPSLLRDLGAQDHLDTDGQPRFTVILVDDRSTDGTGRIAVDAAHGAGLGASFHLVSRPPCARPDGKGAALAVVPKSLLGGEAIVVLDADARLAPDFLRRVAIRVATGTTVMTSRRRVRHADDGYLAAAQGAEQTLDGLQLRARAAFGAFGELRGNGMVLTPAVLDSAGGWPAGSLTEDLELSMRLAARGVPVVWAADLVVWEAPTSTIRALFRQRVRWAEGSIRRFFLLLRPVLVSPDLPTAAKADILASATLLVLPQVLAGVTLGGFRRHALAFPAVLCGVYVGGAVGLTWVALGQEAASDERVLPRRERLTRSLLGGAFETLWLVAIPMALVRIVTRMGPTTFDKTSERLL